MGASLSSSSSSSSTGAEHDDGHLQHAAALAQQPHARPHHHVASEPAAMAEIDAGAAQQAHANAHSNGDSCALMQQQPLLLAPSGGQHRRRRAGGSVGAGSGSEASCCRRPSGTSSSATDDDTVPELTGVDSGSESDFPAGGSPLLQLFNRHAAAFPGKFDAAIDGTALAGAADLEQLLGCQAAAAAPAAAGAAASHGCCGSVKITPAFQDGSNCSCSGTALGVQVVWALPWRSLQAAANGAAPHCPLVLSAASQPFLLPCDVSARGGSVNVRQAAALQWRLELQQAAPSTAAPLPPGVELPSLSLKLLWPPLPANGTHALASRSALSAGSAGDDKLRAHAAASPAHAVLQCSGEVAVGGTTAGQPLAFAAFQLQFDSADAAHDHARGSACKPALPLTFQLPARIPQQGLHDTAAAAPASDDGFLCVTLIVSELQLLVSSAGTATSDVTPSADQQRQQQPLTASSRQPVSASADGLPACTATSSDPSSNAAFAAPRGPGSSSLLPGLVAAPAAAPCRQLDAVLLSTAPRLLVIDNFFDGAMCDGLMELASGKLVRSRVASGSETPSRTSWSHFFVRDAARQALVVEAESLIASLFASPAVRGPHRPLTKVEALQIVKYHQGEFYHEHYDNRADSALTRAATIIVYLTDTPAGGATSFPRAVPATATPPTPGASPCSAFGGDGCNAAADGGGGGGGGAEGGWLPPAVTLGPGDRGVKVFPVRGRALVFWSKRADGQEEANSIHAAEAVESGEKWIATRWMKDD